MNSQVLTSRRMAFLIGVPLAWAILLLFHPGGEGDAIYQDIEDKVTRWQVVHVGMLLFIPTFAAAVYVLLRGVEGTAADVSRVGLAVFVVFYGAFELLQGIANGILVNEVNALSPAERAAGAELIQDFAEHPFASDFGVFSLVGGLGLLVALIAAGIALRRHAGAPVSVPILLGLSGLLIGAHPPPFGPIGLVLFIAAVVIYARSRPTAPTSAAIRPGAG
jgi:hypothetical protein